MSVRSVPSSLGDSRPVRPAALESSRLRFGVAVGLLLLAAIWFLTLDARHLLPSDEGRYAEVAREMLASGDWVTIRYNGLKYFEKPPFQTWMTALSFKAFGIGDWQARLWVAVSGALGLAMTALAAQRWFGPRIALLAALVLLATPAWNLASHFNSLDMGLSGALACALSAFLFAQHPAASPAVRRRWMWLAWAAIAVAILTKGPIGIVLPAIVLAVYSIVARDLEVWRRIDLFRGGAIALTLAAPWFILVSLRNPEFARFFFVHEHIDRYLTTVHHRTAPWWYFLPQLLIGFLPWIGLSKEIFVVVRDDAQTRGFRPVTFLAAWILTILVFFSLSASKLPGYIVPVYPALAIVGALALDRFQAARWQRYLLWAIVLALCALAATPLITRFGSAATPNELYRAFQPWLVAAGAVAVAGLTVAGLTSRRSTFQSIVVYAVTMFVAATVALRGHEVFGRKSSGVDLAMSLGALVGEAPIYSVRMLDHTLPFYLRRTTVMVENADELAFGVAQEPTKWLPTLAEFVRVWDSGPRAFAIMAPATHAQLVAEGVAMTVVARDSRRVVVANVGRSSP